MSSHVESILVDMEQHAKADGRNGDCTRVIEGVKWHVRVCAGSLLWTRDGKRISRKKAAIQIGELLQ